MLLLCAVFLPGTALASTVYVQTNHSEFFVGDTILFNVRVDSGGKTINAAEGEVLLDHDAGGVALTDINTSGSVFSLWLSKPLPSDRNTRITFAGGSPGGFVSSDAILFNVVLKLQTTGQIALSPSNIAVYLNDGKGTRDVVSVRDLIIDVLPQRSGAVAIDDWAQIVSDDTTAPQPFEIYAGQDDSVYDGKKFLSFSTTDAQSGISYYEVLEGDLPPTRSSDTYVLQEQSNPVKVTVIAYDAAGNARKSVYDPAPHALAYPLVLVFVGILGFIMLLIVLAKKRRKTTT